jgi:uncharacterized protein (TIGR02246 family)
MATTPKPTPDVEKTIRALAQEFVRHYNARDFGKLADLFTKDGRLLAPYLPLAQGTAAIREALQQFITEYDLRDLKVETTSVEVDGNLAFGFGTYTVNTRTLQGTRLDENGKWMVNLRREGGTWRIVGHCFNTDLPITTLASS